MEQYLIICLIGYISPCRIYLTPCWLCDIILVVERVCAHVLCFGVGEPAGAAANRAALFGGKKLCLFGVLFLKID